MSGYGTSTLKEQAGKAGELEKQLVEANAKIDKLERGPLREKAFVEYGVDMEGLRPAERRAVEHYDGELDREQIAAFVEEYELPLLNGELRGEQEAQPPAARIAAQATAPATRRGPAQAADHAGQRAGVERARARRSGCGSSKSHPEEAELTVAGTDRRGAYVRVTHRP